MGPQVQPRMMHPGMMNQGMPGVQLRGQAPPVGAVPARPPGAQGGPPGSGS